MLEDGAEAAHVAAELAMSPLRPRPPSPQATAEVMAHARVEAAAAESSQAHPNACARVEAAAAETAEAPLHERTERRPEHTAHDGTRAPTVTSVTFGPGSSSAACTSTPEDYSLAALSAREALPERFREEAPPPTPQPASPPPALPPPAPQQPASPQPAPPQPAFAADASMVQAVERALAAAAEAATRAEQAEARSRRLEQQMQRLEEQMQLPPHTHEHAREHAPPPTHQFTHQPPMATTTTPPVSDAPQPVLQQPPSSPPMDAALAAAFTAFETEEGSLRPSPREAQEPPSLVASEPPPQPAPTQPAPTQPAPEPLRPPAISLSSRSRADRPLEGAAERAAARAEAAERAAQAVEAAAAQAETEAARAKEQSDAVAAVGANVFDSPGVGMAAVEAAEAARKTAAAERVAAERVKFAAYSALLSARSLQKAAEEQAAAAERKVAEEKAAAEVKAAEAKAAAAELKAAAERAAEERLAAERAAVAAEAKAAAELKAAAESLAAAKAASEKAAALREEAATAVVARARAARADGVMLLDFKGEGGGEIDSIAKGAPVWQIDPNAFRVGGWVQVVTADGRCGSVPEEFVAWAERDATKEAPPAALLSPQRLKPKSAYLEGLGREERAAVLIASASRGMLGRSESFYRRMELQQEEGLETEEEEPLPLPQAPPGTASDGSAMRVLVALAEYTGQPDSEEVSLTTGMRLLQLEPPDANGWVGVAPITAPVGAVSPRRMAAGFAPATYLTVLEPDGVMLLDFELEGDSELLQIAKGTPVWIGQIDPNAFRVGGWVQVVTADGRCGSVPEEFVAWAERDATKEAPPAALLSPQRLKPKSAYLERLGREERAAVLIASASRGMLARSESFYRRMELQQEEGLETEEPHDSADVLESGHPTGYEPRSVLEKQRVLFAEHPVHKTGAMSGFGAFEQTMVVQESSSRPPRALETLVAEAPAERASLHASVQPPSRRGSLVTCGEDEQSWEDYLEQAAEDAEAWT